MTRFKLPFLLGVVPLLALFAVDRAIVACDPLWRWSAREVPRNAWAPLRVEGILRTTPPGRQNLLLLGNSSAEFGVDAPELVRSLPGEYHAVNLTVPGSRPERFAMLTPALTRLEAGVAVLVTDAPAMTPRDGRAGIWAYDIRAAWVIHGPADFIAEPIFHLRGFANQVHVLSRHRNAFQDAVGVSLGFAGWDERYEEIMRRGVLRDPEEGDPEEAPWMRWFRGEIEVSYPNTGQRSIAYLAERLNTVGTRLFVVESPSNPIVAISYARRRAARFREKMTEHARAHGYTFIGAPDLGELEASDFDDMIHLNPVGQERFTRQLAAALSARLEGR